MKSSVKIKLVVCSLLASSGYAGDLSKPYLQKFRYDSVATESAPGAANVKVASGVVVSPSGVVTTIPFSPTPNNGISAISRNGETLATELGDWKVLAQGQDLFGNWTDVNWNPSKSIKTVTVYNPWRYMEFQYRFEPAPGQEHWTVNSDWGMLTSQPVQVFLHSAHPTGVCLWHDGKTISVPWGNFIHSAVSRSDGYRNLSGYQDFLKAWQNGFVRLHLRIYRTAPLGPVSTTRPARTSPDNPAPGIPRALG